MCSIVENLLNSLFLPHFLAEPPCGTYNECKTREVTRCDVRGTGIFLHFLLALHILGPSLYFYSFFHASQLVPALLFNSFISVALISIICIGIYCIGSTIN